MNLVIHADGGSRGNPGPAGFGVTIQSQGQTLYEKGEYLGIKTNNEAEYLGLIHALTWVINQKNILTLNTIEVFMDSQLVIRQVNNIYKIKAPHLKILKSQVDQLINQIAIPITFTDVRRNFNSRADELANQAMDAYSLNHEN